MTSRLTAALQGRYTIERQLGEGGMATVYLAEDEKHQRKVALKVLRPELAAIVGAERFLAEIRTTANLQHPHILPLFDSGEADGFLFYVMPHVDGETLADRIERERQLPVDEAIRIAVAVANALQAAHDQGVIHRDIKPGNILLSKGEPLVADFGIALAVGAGGGNRLTETGLSVGTPYYMSPEQATGDQQVGPASDTYSLACVVYEMLVGEPPYLGSTAQAVLARIIQGQPVSVTGHRKAAPANVDAAIRKALEKVPADRFTQVRDFARALGDPAFRHGGDQESEHRRPASRGVRLAHGAVTVALAALAAWGLFRPEPPRTTVRFRMDIGGPASLMPQSLALAPDGSWMVWGGAAAAAEGGIAGQLWLRRLGELDAIPVEGTAGASMVAVSPDGGRLAFIHQGVGLGAGELRVVPLEGGSPRVLADSAYCCTAWGHDGFIYFTDGSFGIRRVPAGGGTSEIILAAPAGEGRLNAGLSNSGKVLFFASASFTEAPTAVSAMRLSDGVTNEVLPATLSVRQLPDGELVYVDPQGTLLAVPFDEGNLRLAGTPVPLARGLDPAQQQFDVSRAGTLAYLEATDQSRMQPVWVNRDGAAEVIDPDWTFAFNPSSTNRGISLSPDGLRVAVSVSGEGQSVNDLWIKQLPRGAFSRLTSGGGDEARPRWTAEGTSLTYTDQGPTGMVAVIQNADGLTPPDTLALAAATEGIAEVQRSPVAHDWFVVRTGLSAGGRLGLAAVRVDSTGSAAERRTIETQFNERAVTISPDGRWIAYESDETGRVEVYVRSFPDVNRRKRQVSVSGGRMPAWGRTGSELFFVNEAREMVAVNVRLGEDLRIGEPSALFTIPPDILVPEQEFYTLFDVDQDDQRFLMLRGTDQSSASIVVVLDPPDPQAPGGGR